MVIDYNDFPDSILAAAIHGGKTAAAGPTCEGDCSMRLNHLNLTVPDVARTREFFETYFGFRCVFERGKNALCVLADDSGFALTLNNFDKETEIHYPGAFHIGFNLESREPVDRMYERLRLAGFDPQPPREFHGAWTFYLRAPGGFLVEVFHQHRAGSPAG
jgi:catechol 2,3-dioxygenase-like lactoylglutathione lyase family enzyme